jgi:hypothetical protein
MGGLKDCLSSQSKYVEIIYTIYYKNFIYTCQLKTNYPVETKDEKKRYVKVISLLLKGALRNKVFVLGFILKRQRSPTPLFEK